MPVLTCSQFRIMQFFWQKGLKRATLEEIVDLLGFDSQNACTLLRISIKLYYLCDVGFLACESSYEPEHRHKDVYIPLCTRRYYVDHAKRRNCRYHPHYDPIHYDPLHKSFLFWWLVEHFKRGKTEDDAPPDGGHA